MFTRIVSEMRILLPPVSPFDYFIYVFSSTVWLIYRERFLYPFLTKTLESGSVRSSPIFSNVSVPFSVKETSLNDLKTRKVRSERGWNVTFSTPDEGGMKYGSLSTKFSWWTPRTRQREISDTTYTQFTFRMLTFLEVRSSTYFDEYHRLNFRHICYLTRRWLLFFFFCFYSCVCTKDLRCTPGIVYPLWTGSQQLVY